MSVGRKELQFGVCVYWGCRVALREDFREIASQGTGGGRDSHGKRIPRGRSRGRKLVHDKFINLFIILLRLQVFGDRLFAGWSWMIPVFVALSTFGGVNGVLFTSARLFATGAQEGHMPAFFSLFHLKKQTPIPSLMFTVSSFGRFFVIIHK